MKMPTAQLVDCRYCGARTGDPCVTTSSHGRTRPAGSVAHEPHGARCRDVEPFTHLAAELQARIIDAYHRVYSR